MCTDGWAASKREEEETEEKQTETPDIELAVLNLALFLVINVLKDRELKAKSVIKERKLREMCDSCRETCGIPLMS